MGFFYYYCCFIVGLFIWITTWPPTTTSPRGHERSEWPNERAAGVASIVSDLRRVRAQRGRRSLCDPKFVEPGCEIVKVTRCASRSSALRAASTWSSLLLSKRAQGRAPSRIAAHCADNLALLHKCYKATETTGLDYIEIPIRPRYPRRGFKRSEHLQWAT